MNVVASSSSPNISRRTDADSEVRLCSHCGGWRTDPLLQDSCPETGAGVNWRRARQLFRLSPAVSLIGLFRYSRC